MVRFSLEVLHAGNVRQRGIAENAYTRDQESRRVLVSGRVSQSPEAARLDPMR